MRGDARIEIGGIARAHGIRGEVVIMTPAVCSSLSHPWIYPSSSRLNSTT